MNLVIAMLLLLAGGLLYLYFDVTVFPGAPWSRSPTDNIDLLFSYPLHAGAILLPLVGAGVLLNIAHEEDKRSFGNQSSD